ncbi:hypothetical protein TYRP_009321 [Tyrophagus putrescentiae]|nr:hypothetical protein TYRP_009321 [Tyrophagus putrescentiae]
MTTVVAICWQSSSRGRGVGGGHGNQVKPKTRAAPEPESSSSTCHLCREGGQVDQISHIIDYYNYNYNYYYGGQHASSLSATSARA